MPLEYAEIFHIEKTPETNNADEWQLIENKLNELANNGYEIVQASATYILLKKR